MATHGQYLEPPIEIPKRHTPWFIWLMGGFALMVVAALIYSFAKIAWLPMPKLEVPAREGPSRPAIPESPAPRPAAPEAK
jgi:hypothetical protein